MVSKLFTFDTQKSQKVLRGYKQAVFISIKGVGRASQMHRLACFSNYGENSWLIKQPISCKAGYIGEII